jgi:hypothetical protein
MPVAPTYYLSVREHPEKDFVLMTESGIPKEFWESELAREYAKAVTEYGWRNVVVGQVVCFCLVGRVEKIQIDKHTDMLQAGNFFFSEDTPK